MDKTEMISILYIRRNSDRAEGLRGTPREQVGLRPEVGPGTTVEMPLRSGTDFMHI